MRVGLISRVEKLENRGIGETKKNDQTKLVVRINCLQKVGSILCLLFLRVRNGRYSQMMLI